MEDKIIIQRKENGVFSTNFENETFSEEGNGATVKESIEDLFHNIEMNECETEEEKVKLFLEKTLPQARQMAIGVFNRIGPDYTKIKDISNKLGMDMDNAKLQLNYLAQYGLAQADRKDGAGQRWKVVLSSDELQQHYFNEAEKWESTAKYYRALGEQIKEVDKIGAEPTETSEENVDNA